MEKRNCLICLLCTDYFHYYEDYYHAKIIYIFILNSYFKYAAFFHICSMSPKQSFLNPLN